VVRKEMLIATAIGPRTASVQGRKSRLVNRASLTSAATTCRIAVVPVSNGTHNRLFPAPRGPFPRLIEHSGRSSRGVLYQSVGDRNTQKATLDRYFLLASDAASSGTLPWEKVDGKVS
jgi:hypothetical protein